MGARVSYSFPLETNHTSAPSSPFHPESKSPDEFHGGIASYVKKMYVDKEETRGFHPACWCHLVTGRFMRTVTVIVTAITIVTVSAMVNIGLPPFRPDVHSGPGATR